MVDFAKFYQAGLEAARIAEKNKEEIESVFNEMNHQLSEATEGRVRISIRTLYDYERPNGLLSFGERKAYTGIVAENPAVAASAKELARWTQNRNGYPCEIILGSNSRGCGDKLALEKALAEMLSDPVVGETLFKLVNLSIPEKPELASIETSDE